MTPKVNVKIRTLIIDDEELARRTIRILLKEDKEIEIIGECSNGTNAIDSIKKLKPDLIFLDVQMPDMSGFEVLQSLKDTFPLIVFVTAYDQYAVDAFKVHAVDYLLKPFKDVQFEETLGHAKQCFKQNKLSAVNEQLGSLLNDIRSIGLDQSLSGTASSGGYLSRLGVKSVGKTYFIDTNEIDWLESDGNYVTAHIGSKNHVVRNAINQLEQKLDPDTFVRIHRSTIVNINRISELQTFTQIDYIVKLKDGTVLRVSRSYLDRLKKTMNYLAG